MKTKKQQLSETPQKYENEGHEMECSFSEHLNKFCIWFNAKLWTYKTFNGFLSKREYFKKKYNLTQTV